MCDFGRVCLERTHRRVNKDRHVCCDAGLLRAGGWMTAQHAVNPDTPVSKLCWIVSDTAAPATTAQCVTESTASNRHERGGKHTSGNMCECEALNVLVIND